jgi:iron complex transport system substrate-binding protein
MISGQKIHAVLFVIILLLSGCSDNIRERKTPKDALIHVKDITGKDLQFEKSPEKVICLIESALSGIYMLGAQDRIIGVPGEVYKEKTLRYYSKLDRRIAERSLPAPGNWDFVSIEQVIGLEPDLVIIWSSQSDVVTTLEQFGIPVYSVMIKDFDDVYKEISDFGKIFGCSQRADSLISITHRNLDKIKPAGVSQKPVSAYFMWAQGINETSGSTSTVEELFSCAGVRNVCEVEQEHVSISLEKLIDWNPDLIIMWYNEKLDPEDVMKDPALQGIDAVKNRKVFELPDKFSCDLWTLKMQYPVQLISAWAHPEKSGKFNADLSLKDMCRFLYQNDLNPVE